MSSFSRMTINSPPPTVHGLPGMLAQQHRVGDFDVQGAHFPSFNISSAPTPMLSPWQGFCGTASGMTIPERFFASFPVA